MKYSLTRELTRLTKDRQLVDRIWLLSCFAVYGYVSSAFFVWAHWSVNDVLTEQKKFRKWLNRVSPILASREYRPFKKRVTILIDFAQIALTYYPLIWETRKQAKKNLRAQITHPDKALISLTLELFGKIGSSPHLLDS